MNDSSKNIQLSKAALENLEIFDKSLFKAIEVACRGDRGWASQTILNELRNFVECVMFLITFQGNESQRNYDYQNICIAQSKVKEQGELRFLWRFHNSLQISVSHYTLDENSSERLMLKYYDWLIDIRSYLDKEFGIKKLVFLDKFPLNTDSTTLEYQAQIARCINTTSETEHNLSQDRYYIQKIIPFYVNNEKFYEITFTSVNEEISKFDRHIAFSKYYIPDFYAVKLSIRKERITILNRNLPVLIITRWETSIRPCELNNYASLFQIYPKINSGTGYQLLMKRLTTLQLSLTEIVFHPLYENIKQELTKYSNITTFFKALDKAKQIIANNNPGGNVLSYLLYNLRNKIIKTQRGTSCNQLLSSTILKNGCLPFDKMPYCSSLLEHNPSIYDILSCIKPISREHEFLARFVRNNAETHGKIYTKKEELPDDLQKKLEFYIQEYNNSLWYGHYGRKLKIRNNFIYIAEYEDDIVSIIRNLHSLSLKGIPNYENWVNSWFSENSGMIDSDEKKTLMKNMFKDSCVSFVYGAAGTGKTTLIKYISMLFSENKKMFLAQTHPAIENLRRKIITKNSSFFTVSKALILESPIVCDLLVIDECSTVSNKDMKEILEKISFKWLLLVGDIYQIRSINFGNWFNLGKMFVSKCISELNSLYRSSDKNLLVLWNKVREMNEHISEYLQKNKFSSALNDTIFYRSCDDEIILCLNYDGVYGINNLNRILQQNNKNKAVYWNECEYRIGDPILFNETSRFGNSIYNNMKGHIYGIEIIQNSTQIQFDIELDQTLNMSVSPARDFTIIGSDNGYSIIRFIVDKTANSDEDYDSAKNVVPFQIAYAVSIHKAQGLEYRSVKIVIASEIGEQINHSIFYTAITRARENLKIYWSPECEKFVLEKILKEIKVSDNTRDYHLLRNNVLKSL